MDIIDINEERWNKVKAEIIPYDNEAEFWFAEKLTEALREYQFLVDTRCGDLKNNEYILFKIQSVICCSPISIRVWKLAELTYKEYKFCQEEYNKVMDNIKKLIEK